MQEDKDGIDRPVLYESVTFSAKESEYAQSKLELLGVLKILKKLQTILWGQHFELQVDAKALIQMINTPSLPSAPMTRWVAFIQLFSFELVHKPGKTFTMPDGLSRRPVDKGNIAKNLDKEEGWIKPPPVSQKIIHPKWRKMRSAGPFGMEGMWSWFELAQKRSAQGFPPQPNFPALPALSPATISSLASSLPSHQFQLRQLFSQPK